MGSHTVRATHKKARSRVNQSLQHIPVQWDNWKNRSTENPVGINHVPVRPPRHMVFASCGGGHGVTIVRAYEVTHG